MKGYLTSYARLFDEQQAGAPRVDRIEIPLIQRDYAQGRPSSRVGEIRATFLDVLLDAAGGGEPVGLDFVYGRVENATFRPLDGQQRLSTLFLLHWYLASRAGRMTPGASWTRFSYATRPSARLFCERLAVNPLPEVPGQPSEWIIDQPWYLATWRSDPTIQAMLVMLDAIDGHVCSADLDVRLAWERLTNDATPAVSFYLLPLDDLTAEADLYIKMNSRGKPLTPFENFKAIFERDIEYSHRASEFAHKVDGEWADLFWRYHGGDNIVDDEFLRYIDFVTEICEFRDGRAADGALSKRARVTFGATNPRGQEHLDFLFDAFDCWLKSRGIQEEMDAVFSTAAPGDESYDAAKVALFGATGTNVFEDCVRTFGETRGNARVFSLQQSLLLYAVLLHLIEGTDDFPRRLRILRNLLTASEDQVRQQDMAALIKEAEAVVRTGSLDDVTTFNRTQVEDERRKQSFLAQREDLSDVLFRLEDHPILRGALSVFDLEPESFQRRAVAFEAVLADRESWPELTGALLATGDYQRQPSRSTQWQFGSPNMEVRWRYLLTATTESGLAPTRDVLGKFLDGYAASGQTPAAHFENVMGDWLSRRESRWEFDWRYYLVKYSSMRSGDTGIYYGVDGEMGYSMCMLRRTQLNSNYRDPILLEIWQSSAVGELARDPWFTGWDTAPRWLRLERSGIGLRSVPEGFALDGADGALLPHEAIEVVTRHGKLADIDGAPTLLIAKGTGELSGIDSSDRVQVGAALLRDLTDAGY